MLGKPGCVAAELAQGLGTEKPAAVWLTWDGAKKPTAPSTGSWVVAHAKRRHRGQAAGGLAGTPRLREGGTCGT